MRAVVVGGGAMGRVVALDLARSDGVEAVTVADLDPAAARAGAEFAGGAAAGVTAAVADVSAPVFSDALRGHDVCVAATAYRLNPRVAQACLEAGCGYVDLGGLFHVARTTLEMHDRFRDAGLTGVTCMGGAPGISNMLALVAARELSSVERIGVRLGSFDPSVQGLPLPIPYSLDTLLDEFSVPAMAFRDGGFVEVEPLGEPEEVSFPEPVGRRTVHTTLHSEVATLPRRFDGVREVTFKISFEEELVERFRLLATIGLASQDLIDVRGQQLRPRDVLVALGRRLPQAAGTDDVECLRVEVDGVREGSPATAIAEMVVEPDPALQLGGGARDTGYPPSVVAQMIASGEIAEKGMFAPEDVVDPDAFFGHLERRGLRYDVRVQRR